MSSPGARPTARVLLIDDSVVVRRLVADVLGAVDGIEVAGTAANGRIGLQKIPQTSPDLVVLDVEMPDMDGMATLVAIRERHPHLPVVMFSSATERGAAITLEALMRGANDYVTKPANAASAADAMERVRDELVPRIFALCKIAPALRQVEPARVRPAGPRTVAVPAARVDAVVIGVSTGGPNALAALVPALRGELAVPVLVVQHMPATFTRLLAQRLDVHSELHVREARGGEIVRAGECWIAPGDRHLELVADPDGTLRTVVHDAPKVNSVRPSVDVLFSSAARALGRHALGVVMTGMGHDGLQGSQDLVAVGARVVVQDEASSVVWGMPGSVVRAGLSDTTVPLHELAAEIDGRVGRTRRVDATGATR